MKRASSEGEACEQMALKRLRDVWGARLHTDAVVRCGEQSWPVHRAILASASPVLGAMFSSPMIEGSTATITIADAEPRAVGELLEFVYVGTSPALSDQADGLGKTTEAETRAADLMNLLELARVYAVPELQHACLDILVCDTKPFKWKCGGRGFPGEVEVGGTRMYVNCVDANGANCEKELMALQKGTSFSLKLASSPYERRVTAAPTKQNGHVVIAMAKALTYQSPGNIIEITLYGDLVTENNIAQLIRAARDCEGQDKIIDRIDKRLQSSAALRRGVIKWVQSK